MTGGSSGLGWQRTFALVKQGYYWPEIKDDAIEYTKTCLTLPARESLKEEDRRVLGTTPSTKSALGEFPLRLNLKPSEGGGQQFWWLWIDSQNMQPLSPLQKAVPPKRLLDCSNTLLSIGVCHRTLSVIRTQDSQEPSGI